MFENLITFQGKHAHYMKKLTDMDIGDENKLSIFERNLDVYLTAPVIGYINDRRESEEIGEYKNVTAKISVEQLIKEGKNLEIIFRTIMLLDEHKGIDEEAQIRRAFRDDSNKEINDNHKDNMESFNSYVRGGISILYEALIENAAVKDDYLKNIFTYVKIFNKEIIDGITDEELELEIGYK